MIRRKLEFSSKSLNSFWGVKPNTFFQSSSNGVIREFSLIKVPTNAQISAIQGREISGKFQMIANLPSGARPQGISSRAVRLANQWKL